MYRKNTASQFVGVQLLLTATGAVATGLSPTVRRCIDGTFGAGGGTVTEDSNGFYKYAMAQADTNGNDISLTFSATGAMPVCINFVTTAADPTAATNFGITALPAVASGSAGAVIISGTGTAALSVSSGLVTLAGVTHSGAVIPTVTTVTNQLTAAAIATGIWTDTTAGDFTTALSVGKSVMNGVTLGTGLTVNAVTGLTASNLDAAVSSRMATYTQPTGFLAATFPTGTVANTTNITSITGNITGNLSGSVGSVTGAVGSVTGAVGSVTGAVGSVTGNVGGNVVGSVASVTARVTANVDQLNADATSAANIAKTTRAIGRATVSGSPSVTSIPTSACTPSGAVADQFKGRIITFDADTTSTALRGQATDITASSNSATPTFTVTALTTAPASGDTFSIT